MGVSVRLSRNVRMYVPFWVAIPVYAAAAVVYIAFGICWVVVQLIGACVKAARRRREAP
jgi:hypothetical protein